MPPQDETTTKKKRFLLLRYFSAAAGVTVLCLSLLVALLYRENATDAVVNAKENDAVNLARVFTNALWPTYRHYALSQTRGLSGDTLRARQETKDILTALRDLTLGTPIVKVKIYNVEGLTIFSTEARQIGQNRATAPPFTAALRQGKSTSQLSDRATFAAIHGEIFDRRIVETYIPIQGPGGAVEGVFEIYTDATVNLAALDGDTADFVLALLALFSVFYGVLYVIVRRADQIIAGQYNALSQEIGERRRLEQVKSDFLANVSHELRTPLTSIRGALGLLSGGMLGKLDTDSRRLVDMALSNSERLALLVNDILDVEQIGSGRLEYAYADTDLTEIAEQAISDNHAYAEKFEVKITLDARPDRAPLVADRVRISQVLTNLLSNAVKFSPPGDVVSVRLEDGMGTYRLEVEDHGPGIPPEFRPQIFERFTQATATDTRARGGSGLGLAISKAIIEDHGGTIAFETKAGRGTVFIVTLPKTGTARQPAA